MREVAAVRLRGKGSEVVKRERGIEESVGCGVVTGWFGYSLVLEVEVEVLSVLEVEGGRAGGMDGGG